MTFLHPAAFLGLVVAAPLLLWLARRRAEPLRIPVPSLIPWRHLGATAAAPAAVARVKLDRRLLLEALAVLSLVASAAGPALQGRGDAPRRLALILDDSPSMGAAAADGGTRAAAIAAERARFERGLQQGDQVEVIHVHDLGPGAQPGPEGASGDPLALAAIAATGRGAERAIVFTDHPLPEPQPAGVRVIVPAAAHPNGGIVGATAQRLEDGSTGVWLRLWLPEEARRYGLDLRAGDSPAVHVEEAIPPSSRAAPRNGIEIVVRKRIEPLAWDPAGAAAAALEVRLSWGADGLGEPPDGLAADDAITFLPTGSPPRVRIGEGATRSLLAALRAAGAVLVTAREADDDGVDVGADVVCSSANAAVEPAQASLPRIALAARAGSGAPAGLLARAPASPLRYTDPAGVSLPVAPAEPPLGLRAAIIDQRGRTVVGFRVGSPPLLWIGVPLDDAEVEAAWSSHSSFAVLAAEGLALLLDAAGGATTTRAGVEGADDAGTLRVRGLRSPQETREADSRLGLALPPDALPQPAEGGARSLAAALLALGCACAVGRWSLG